MAEAAEQLQNDGQEVQKTDYNLLAITAALADDHVLAELLRIQPYDGTTVYKAILPAGLRQTKSGLATLQSNIATVRPTGANDGSIHIMPFRAVIGSRNLYSAAVPSGDLDAPPANGGVSPDSNGMASWRNIRSGIYVGTSSSALQGAITIVPNTSGSERWDLVYATLALDANGPSVVRRVKDPNSGALTTPNVAQYITSPVTVSVVQGTAAHPPTRPSLPADAAGNYNIALAYVRVPNGFNASNSVSTKDIVATTSTGALFQKPGATIRVCSGNNDANSAFTTSTGPFYYDPTSAGSRPGPFMPPDWLGREEFIAEIDCSNASSLNWSHASGGIVDDTIDWRNRFIKVWCAIGSNTSKFANDPTISSNVLPYAASQDVRAGGSGTAGPNVQMSQSFFADGLMNAGFATVLNVQASMNSTLAAGSAVGLYVDNQGRLAFYNNGTAPLVKLFIWIEATGQMTNY